jgi:hypothetical protein
MYRFRAADPAIGRHGGDDVSETIGRLGRWLAARLSPREAIRGRDFLLPPEAAAGLAGTASGDLERLFFATRGVAVNKWLHYLPIYERYFAPYRGTPVRMLEIGVSRGGSLDLWRRYFGADATIFGIDIDPACLSVVAAPNQVRIGSQADPAFLLGVIEELGAPDIILDDGSHVATHQQASFETLFPRLKEGGLYVIEDLHTAYWPDFDGGHRRPGTAIELVKQMIDDMHGWYHRRPTPTPAKDAVGAIHVHDSLVVLEKRRRARPSHILVGP